MRGHDEQTTHMFSYLSPEQRVPADHSLRAVRALTDEALQTMSRRFASLYATTGRPSIPPEQLLRALLLQVLYTVRSERLLMEELNDNLLFRWFVGLNMDDPVWHPTTFTKNRDRLLSGDVAAAFFDAVQAHARAAGLLSDEHFTVDGTQLEAWASLKSFRCVDAAESDPPEALLRGSNTDPQRPRPTDPLTTDSVRRRPTKLSHLIEDVTCEDGLRLLPRPTARSKALPDDHLVPEEGVLHTGLLMVARVRLPLSPSSLLHLSDRAVARGRSWSPSRHGGCPGRWNDDRRATRTRSLVDATRVVGRVRREAGDVAFDLVDQIEGRRRVVNMPAGQGVSDDHARSVDAQMKFLPAAYPASAMFHGRPFTCTHSREPGTVDDEMYACARGEAAKCKVEVLTTP